MTFLPLRTNARSAPHARRAAALAALLLTGAGPAVRAADTDDSATRIGAVVITGNPLRGDNAATAQMMRQADALTTAAALELIPGVSQSRVGARNEQMVYVRGFDLRQVPLFIDGVPVYVPYDGYVDLGRFNTFDLSRMQVDKGASSMLYGANTLGGAINLVGRRPTRPLELDAGLGLNTGRSAAKADASWGYANLGLRQAQWYAQASVSHLAQSGFDLPAGVAATKAEDGGARNNSDLRDRKLALKLGWTPGGDDEYTINVIDQHGTKGTPPYAGALASVTPRYWRWPYWDKQSVYALSRTAIGAHVLKLRVFHDTFQNSLFAYDDATYTTQKKGSSFQSWYDDYSNGASAQFDWALSAANTLGIAAHWKDDVHREHNLGEPVRHNEDRTQSFALEDSHRFSPTSSLVAGLGHDTRQTVQAQEYNATTKTVSEAAHGDGSANNGQVAFNFAPAAGWQARASLARKSRFPTIKDRYSYRLGTALPNADLKPERATHVELGLAGRPLPWLQLDAAVFRSDITDLIQSVSVSTMCGTSACLQAQNIGKVRAQGLEVGGEARLGAWQLDGHYQHLDRDNLSRPDVRLTDTPRHQLMAHLGWTAAPALTLHGHLKLSSSRFSSSDGLQVAAKFAVLDLKAVWRATPLLDVEAGVHNLTDRLYAYAEGFPEPGRQIFVQGRLRWQ
jgi:iron complex outermembrane receptor protein